MELEESLKLWKRERNKASSTRRETTNITLPLRTTVSKYPNKIITVNMFVDFTLGTIQ